VHYRSERAERKNAEKYIPFMPPTNEKEIIAYILHHNQKMFTCSIDGGYASTLISHRIVKTAFAPNQIFDQEAMPVGTPDHIWEVLVRHRASFAYAAADNRAHAWRIPWMTQ
jgi:hypothetical protein